MLDLDFIEACYAEAESEAAWGTKLAERIARLVPDAKAVMGGSYVVEAEGLRYLDIKGDARFAAVASNAAGARRLAAVLSLAPHRAVLMAVYGRSQPNVGLISDLPRELRSATTNHLPWGTGDSVGCFGTLDGRSGYFLGPAQPNNLRVSLRRRQQLTRLSEHLATGYWLHALRGRNRSLEHSAAAVCTPDGKLVHQDPSETPELARCLVDAVRGMDRARCRRRKHTADETTELWQALLVGQYTLVESAERDGRRLIVAVRCRTPRPVLTERETAVAVSAARGAANKKIAAELGMATGTVGVHLAAALRKLGCSNRRALVQWLGHAPTVAKG